MKEEFIQLLKSTGRDGVDTVISNLERLGFFEAPASTRFHLSCEGGLVQHSMNVCSMATMLREQLIAREPALEKKLPLDSVVLTALLHDVCKAGIYVKETKNVKNKETGVWEVVPTYGVDYSRFPYGHGEKSVMLLTMWGMPLTANEMLAIRWHMSAWDLPFQSHEEMGNLNAAKEKCPLLSLLQAADGLASGILEGSWLTTQKSTDEK